MTRKQIAYRSFVRAVKKQHGVTHAQALQIRRAVVAKTGQPPSAKYVRDHPIITKRLVKASERTKVVKKPVPPPAPKGVKVTSISQWERMYSGVTERFVVNAGVDTGRKKKR